MYVCAGGLVEQPPRQQSPLDDNLAIIFGREQVFSVGCLLDSSFVRCDVIECLLACLPPCLLACLVGWLVGWLVCWLIVGAGVRDTWHGRRWVDMAELINADL